MAATKKCHNICKECGATRREAREIVCEQWDDFSGEYYWGDHHIWTY